jgi:hypothetical protein
MKLSYRGATYEYNQPTLEVTEGEILGSYRETTWRCKTLQEVPAAQQTLTLQYLGATYIVSPRCHNRLLADNVVSDQRNAELAMGCPITPAPQEVAKIQQAHLKDSLRHRLRIAQEKGNEALISLLESERRQLAL